MPSSPWSTSGGSGNATAATTGLGTAADLAKALNLPAAANLIPNGDSELGPIAGIGGLFVTATGVAYSGAYCRVLLNSVNVGLSAITACKPGEQLTFSLMALCNASSDSHARIYFSWRNAAGGEIDITGFQTMALNSTNWTAWSTTATAPAGAVGFTFAIGSMAAGVTYYLDNLIGYRITPELAAAIAEITNITSDNVLTTGEKGAVVLDYNAIINEQAGIDAQAVAFLGASSGQQTTYDAAVTALTTYLTGLSPAYNNVTAGQDTTIVGTTFRQKFTDVYAARQVLFNAIYAKAKALADAAQTTGNQINSVDYLTNSDKIQLIQDWANEQQTKGQLDTQASTLGVSATAYDSAVAALSTGLISAGAPSGWATSWPDGTTLFATSIMANLKTWWTSVALNRATLQTSLTAKVQANAAYADALSRSSYNQIKNGSSEMGTSAKPGSPEADHLAASVGGSSRNGAWLRVIGNYSGTSRPGYGEWINWSSIVQCRPGEQFYFEFYARKLNGSAGTSVLNASWRDTTGSEIGNTITTMALATSYQKHSAQLIAPAGACGVVFATGDQATPNNQEIWFDDAYAGRMVGGALLEGDAIQTTNYTQDGSGNPTAGARMDISGTALKVVSSGFQIGTYIFTDFFWRQLQAIDGSNGNRVVYRGNVDTTTRSGAPNIGCLSVTRRRWDTTNKIGRLELAIQPSASGASDNLDAMRFAQIVLYRQSVAGTTATTTAVDTYYLPFNDRSYYNFGTDTNAGNVSKFTFETIDSLIISGVPAAVVTLFNAYGPSSGNVFYAAAGNTDGSALTNNGTTWPAGITGGSGGETGGGGGGGGGGCPAPWVEITLASGLLVHAADIYDGAQVVGVDDLTMKPALGIVRRPVIRWVDRVPIILEDGRAPEFSLPHRLAVEGRGWIEVRHLRPGDSLIAQTPSIVKGLGKPIKAQVVSFQVEGCATYFADGILSHNNKIMIPY